MDEHAEYEGLLDQALPVPMGSGDVLLFDGTIFHTVGVNHGTGNRTVITMAYQSMDELGGVEKRILVRGERLYRGNDV
jgi:ectoine hydroxylase-related dioxygenase (phytanoyl-CoA dioxygenase family)